VCVYTHTSQAAISYEGYRYRSRWRDAVLGVRCSRDPRTRARVSAEWYSRLMPKLLLEVDLPDEDPELTDPEELAEQLILPLGGEVIGAEWAT
jgi:hypothetical protein